MNDQRSSLASCVDKRVSVEGVFERLAEARGGKFRVALVQDAVVSVTEEQIDLGHVWVQHADNFVTIEQFERVTFLARVGERKRANTNGDTEKVYNLMFPTQIRSKNPPALRIPRIPTKASELELLQESVQVEPPEPKPGLLVPEPKDGFGGDPVQILLDVSALAVRVGGWARLEALINALKATDR
jgi:hypothetical protein